MFFFVRRTRHDSGFAEKAHDHIEDRIWRKRFEQCGIGSHLLADSFGIEGGGQNDDGGEWGRHLAIGLNKLPSIHDWHPHIEQDEIGLPVIHHFERLRTIGRDRQLEARAAQRHLKQAADRLVIIHDQDAMFCAVGLGHA